MDSTQTRKATTLSDFTAASNGVMPNVHTLTTMKKPPPTPQIGGLTAKKMFKSMTIAELGATFSGVLPKDAIRTPHPRAVPQASKTTEKNFKPMTMAELKATFPVLNARSPMRLPAQVAASAKKRWNSSVKLDKKGVSHTTGGKMKHNTVRKTLNFNQPRAKVPQISTYASRMTTVMAETPKPEIKMKKPPHVMAHDISGICPMPEISQPKITKPIKSTLTTLTNKENISNHLTVNKKIATTPKSSLHKKVLTSKIMDTPLSNESWKSNGDASFLQNEKDIQMMQDKIEADEKSLQSMPISPPASTPFRKYRNVKEFFNNSSVDMDNSGPRQDDTITCFSRTESKENSKREESVIVSLCDLLNKARVSTSNNIDMVSTELDDLLKIEKQTENDIKMIEYSIKLLDKFKESQQKSLDSLLMSLRDVKQLIDEKKCSAESNRDKPLIKMTNDNSETKMDITPSNSPVTSKPCSVIKSCLKSPSYKIPKKNMSSVQKRVTYKSMLNISNTKTPSPKCMGTKALSVYMKMKEQMNFLNTPTANRREAAPDTPAITSRNLQKQLDKLYDETY